MKKTNLPRDLIRCSLAEQPRPVGGRGVKAQALRRALYQSYSSIALRAFQTGIVGSRHHGQRRSGLALNDQVTSPQQIRRRRVRPHTGPQRFELRLGAQSTPSGRSPLTHSRACLTYTNSKGHDNAFESSLVRELSGYAPAIPTPFKLSGESYRCARTLSGLENQGGCARVSRSWNDR